MTYINSGGLSLEYKLFKIIKVFITKYFYRDAGCAIMWHVNFQFTELAVVFPGSHLGAC